MAWHNSTPQDSDEQDNIWLTWPPLKKVNDYVEQTVRILDNEPVDVWQHWHERRPYNCPGFKICPMCHARAKIKGTEEYKLLYPMRQRFFFNVLTQENGEPVVRVFGFGSSVSKKLWAFQEKYLSDDGPLTNYDVSVRKTKIGPTDQNVEYDVLKEKVRELSKDEQNAALALIDLEQFAIPAEVEALRDIVNGVVRSTIHSEEWTKKMETLVELASKKGMTLDHMGVDSDSPEALLDQLISGLRDSDIPF